MKKVSKVSAAVALVLGLSALAVPRPTGAATEFTTYSLRGTYKITFTGYSVATGRLESGLGIFVADGLGHLSGTEVFNRGTGAAGAVCNVTVTGTYTINANGIGALRATYTSPTPGCSGEFNSALMLSEGADLVKSISTDASFVTISEEWRRQPEQ